ESHLPQGRHNIDRNGTQRLEYQRTNEGGRDRGGSSKDGDKDEAAGGRPIGHIRIDMADRKRSERATETAEHARNNQLGMDDTGNRYAEKFDTDFIVADRSGKRASDRTEIAAHQYRCDGIDGQRKPIEREAEGLAVRGVAEEGRRSHAESIGRAERFSFHQHTVENHRQREAQHREENFAITREQKTDQSRDQPRSDAAE